MPQSHPFTHALPSNLIVAATYLFLGILSHELALVTEQAMEIMFSAGFALAVGMVRPKRYVLPGVFIGAYLLYVWHTPIEAINLASTYLQAFFVSVAFVTQVFVGVWLLKARLKTPLTFSEDKQIIDFLLCVPVVALIGSTLIALMGQHFWLGWLGNILGTLILFPVTLSYVSRPRYQWRKHRFNLTLIPIITVLVTTFFAYKVNEVESIRLDERFKNRTQEFANLFQLALRADELLLNSLTHFFVASEHVSREEFSLYVRDMLTKHKYAEEAKWMPRIELAQRAEYEASQAEFYNAPFSIQDITADRKLVSAAQRSVYFPITYIEPEWNNTQARGYDLASSPEARRLINEVIASGEMKARGPLTIRREAELAQALVMYKAIYQTGDRYTLDPRAGEVAGLVSVTVKTHDFVKTLLLDGFEDFGIEWVDQASGLHYFKSKTYDASEVSYSVPFTIASRPMSLIFHPSPSFYVTSQSYVALMIISIGYLSAALMSLWLLIMRNRTHRVEQIVQQRTQQHLEAVRQAESSEQHMRRLYHDIQKAEQQLQMSDVVFHSTTEAMMLTDGQVHVISVNPAFRRLTGFKQADILGSLPRFLVGTLSEHDYSQFSSVFWDSINETGVWKGEVVSQRKSGESFPAYLSVNAVFDVDKRIKNMVVFVSDLTDIKATQAEIERHAHYDPLTGLPNRRLFLDRLSQATLRAERNDEKVCLMFLDLDRFKDVNDTLGHEVGDKLLKTIAERINRSVREVDTVARLGGDEFTIIMHPFKMKSHAVNMAQKLISEIELPVDVDGHVLRVSTSIGITFYPDDTVDSGVLLQNADRAMYAAKEVGGGAFKFYTSELESNWQSRTFIINELEQAISLQQLLVYYQPLIQIDDEGEDIYVEALVRWQHPQRGLIPPNEFLPQAEGMGLIEKIDDYVFKSVCDHVEQWLEQGVRLRVSVNRSAHNFGNTRGRLDWLAYLKARNLDPTQFTIEITESVLMQRQAESRHIIRRFREAGVHVAVDDFGTGYSSLSYLKEMEIDYLKVDRSFVRDLEFDENDKAIIQAIVEMAKHLGIKLIAEGVETEPQQQILTEMGCHWLQGYLFAKPMNLTDLERYVADKRSV